MGQKVICIISDDDLVFTGMHDLNEPESTGYISVNCGGSLHIDRDVEVVMEYSPEVLAQYNKSKYDIDEREVCERTGFPLLHDSRDAGDAEGFECGHL